MKEYADFTYTPTYPAINSYNLPITTESKVVFYDKSVGPTAPTNWFWTVDGAFFSNEQNPSYKFTTPGNHTIFLQAADYNVEPSWKATTTVTIFVGDGVPLSTAVPLAGQQYFDNDGNPLANGWITSYAAGGFTYNRPTFDTYESMTTYASKSQLDANGRYQHSASNTIPMGYNYNFVVTKPDGETVLQAFDDIHTPQVLAGDNIRIGYNPVGEMFQFTVNSVVQNVNIPASGMEPGYLYWMQATDYFPTNGNFWTTFTTLEKVLPGVDVEWDAAVNVYRFLRGGWYQIATNFTFTYDNGIPGEESTFTVLGHKNGDLVSPVIASTVSPYNHTFYNVMNDYTLADTNVIAVLAGDEVQFVVAAVDQLGGGRSATVKGSVILSRMGDVPIMY
jgi:hypothetical protein